MNNASPPPRGRGLLVASVAMFLLTVPVRVPAQEPAAAAPATFAADTLWQGRLLVETPLTVPAGVTLTVRAGATILFRAGAGITVLGILRAEGTTGQPVTFSPEGGEPWAGISLVGGGQPSLLRGCRVLGAKALAITSGGHVVEDCEIADGGAGVDVNGDAAQPILKGNRIHDLREGGVRCVGKSAPLVEGNTIERCGPFGVHVSQGAAALIQGNTIADCVNGIELIQAEPLIRDNRVRRCERGIALSSAGPGRPVAGNTIENCGAGIFIQQMSSPEFSGNTIAGNKEGIVCFMGARPFVHNNAIRENGTGIFCNQISAPTIEANAIERNRRGIFLTLSSYAILHGNNIEGNEVQMELGNMSRDWERRVGKKPMRGRLQQNAVRAGRGLSPQGAAAEGGDGFEVAGGAVEATGNWWGEAMTREMEEKGPDADIAGLRDWHDVPTLTYEGYEGEYVQDRIRYAPWAKTRIATAGIAGAGAAAPAGPAPEK